MKSKIIIGYIPQFMYWAVRKCIQFTISLHYFTSFVDMQMIPTFASSAGREGAAR